MLVELVIAAFLVQGIFVISVAYIVGKTIQMLGGFIK